MYARLPLCACASPFIFAYVRASVLCTNSITVGRRSYSLIAVGIQLSYKAVNDG